MKKEFFRATIIFLIFLVGFYILSASKRRSEDRIGTLAGNKIYSDYDINPPNYPTEYDDNPKYRNIYYISYANDKNYIPMVFNKDKTQVTIPLVFMYYNTDIPNETKNYTFVLTTSADDCTGNCIKL